MAFKHKFLQREVSKTRRCLANICCRPKAVLYWSYPEVYTECVFIFTFPNCFSFSHVTDMDFILIQGHLGILAQIYMLVFSVNIYLNTTMLFNYSSEIFQNYQLPARKILIPMAYHIRIFITSYIFLDMTNKVQL